MTTAIFALSINDYKSYERKLLNVESLRKGNDNVSFLFMKSYLWGKYSKFNPLSFPGTVSNTLVKVFSVKKYRIYRI